jgi:ATP-binding cassette subfamily B protein
LRPPYYFASRAVARWRSALAASARLRALRLLTASSPGLAAGVGAFVLAEAVLPNLTIVAMGRAAGRIPPAVSAGLASAAGRQLGLALVVAGCLYAASLLRGPVEDALSAAVRARLTVVFQGRLVAAVSAPAGIGHLEDPVVLDRLASAQGELTSYQPADAPMAVAGVIGDRLSGVLACAVLATFHWWLGLTVLAMWLLVRRPVRALVVSRVSTFRQSTEPLRRGWYFLGLAWRPAAAKESRVFGLGDWLVARHRQAWLEGVEPSWRDVGRLNRQVAAAGLLVLAVYALAAGALGWEAYRHAIGLTTLAVMLPMLVASMPAGSVTAADYGLETMLSALPDLDRLTADLARPAALPEAGLPVAGLPREEVRFEGVAFRYPGGDRDVVSGLDLVLPAGRSLAIVGVNGAGKTTLVTLLARLRDPTAGRITVDGRPLDQLAARDWQRQVAVVFQEFTRYPLTAAENVALGLLDEEPDPAALRRAARRAGALQLVEGLPHGWDTVLAPRYRRGTDLSGGQWQRIALARALYAVERGARVLVLDEPTAQLDVRSEAAFYERFLEITAGVTSVVISHRFSTVRRADRIAVLDAGRISELGSHDELLRVGGTYARMFQAQADRFAAP